MQGTVLSAVGGVYDIELPGGAHIEAVLRGRLKRNQKADDRVVAGDDVRVSQQEGSWVIEGVEPRRSQLNRRAPGPGRPRPKTIAANIDRIVLVFAAARPEPNPRTLDRLLVLAEANDIAAVIVINKTDLAPPQQVEAFLAPYRAAGYATSCASVVADRGIEELRTLLCGARSALTGPSGVGKSTLLNAVQPGLGLRIGAISDAVGKGRHTTVAARLIPLGCGGYVADTPGLREVGLWNVDRANLDGYFPEFRAYLGTCRYARSCSHTHEPGCAILGAVQQGGIAAARYDSYRTLYDEQADA